ncbi:MAG: LON peptidase substrate-binding domain-containing protein [Oleiphilus sp.]
MDLSVFPLNAIVCPKGRISLRIFEPRYLDMVRRCLRENEPFVVTLYSPEKQAKPQFYSTGTLVHIVDFGDALENGVLQIVVEGICQVSLRGSKKQADGLWLAEVEKHALEPFVPMPQEFDELCLVLKALVKHPFVEELHMQIDFDDARQVGWRLTELLPLGNAQKQYLYEIDNSHLRLSKIADQLSGLVE